MYENTLIPEKINITKIQQNKINANFTPLPNHIYDINLESIGSVNDVQQNRNLKS